VSGVGTAGTLIGAGKLLKEKINLKLYAIEPKNAPILSKSAPLNKHQIQGLSDEVVPKIYNKNLVDKIIQIDDNDAIAMSQKLCKELSLGVGVSSGANFLGCVLSGNNSASVFADSNKKYLSTNLTQNVQSYFVDKIKLISMKLL
jgi:cysteine synthase A